MGIKDKLGEFREKYATRVGAAGFMYGLMVYGGAALIINEPTRTFYNQYKEILSQPDLGILGEGAQYLTFWWILSHVGGGLAAILGFAAGPKFVDQVRRPVDWAGKKLLRR